MGSSAQPARVQHRHGAAVGGVEVGLHGGGGLGGVAAVEAADDLAVLLQRGFRLAGARQLMAQTADTAPPLVVVEGYMGVGDALEVGSKVLIG